MKHFLATNLLHIRFLGGRNIIKRVVAEKGRRLEYRLCDWCITYNLFILNAPLIRLIHVHADRESYYLKIKLLAKT